MRRRTTIRGMCVGLAGILAGCANPNQPPEGEQSPQSDSTSSEGDGSNTQGNGEDDTADQDSGNTDATEQVELPGEPVQSQNSTLAVQGISTVFESESQGFDGTAEGYDYDADPLASFEPSHTTIREDETIADMIIASDHLGAGRAFGLTAASFRTAWKAPADGQYEISSSYLRHAEILYNSPDSGNVSATFNVSLIVTDYENNEVVSKQTQPELQHKDGDINEELAEFFISKGAAFLLGRAFGLGLIARFVIGNAINEILDIGENSGDSDSDIYDTRHYIPINPESPSEINVNFEAEEGEVFIFELTTNHTFGFELEEPELYQPTTHTHVDWKSFYIERIS